MLNFGVENGQFWTPRIHKKYPQNLKNGHRGAKFPFSGCQNYTDKSISQIPPGPPNRGSKPPGGVATPTPPPEEKTVEWGGEPQGGERGGGGGKIVNFGGEGGWGGGECCYGEEATE